MTRTDAAQETVLGPRPETAPDLPAGSLCVFVKSASPCSSSRQLQAGTGLCLYRDGPGLECPSLARGLELHPAIRLGSRECKVRPSQPEFTGRQAPGSLVAELGGEYQGTNSDCRVCYAMIEASDKTLL
eukprot:923907-Rhodomonas_salina.1